MTSSIQVGLFSPSSIANCVQWLNASDLTSLFQSSNGTTPVTTNGQSVAFWTDRSGCNNSVFQSGATAVPTYCNVLVSSQPGLNFTNTSLLKSSNFQNSSNLTAFVMGMVKNTIGGWGVFWGQFPNGDHDNYISLRNTSGQAVINWHTANDNSIYNLSYTVDSPVIYYGTMCNRFNTFFSQTNTTGTTTITSNVGGTINSGTMPVWVGQSDSAEAIQSYIAEIIYYHRVLTPFEQQQVQGYLAWKYNLQTYLPTTNPYRNAPYLMITESVPRSIPTATFLLPINTVSTVKTFILPTVSTNPGRILVLKDYLGYAGSNTIRLSTVGLDKIELSNVSSMILSNAYGAYWFANDGATRWFLTDAYLNSLYLAGPSGGFRPTQIATIVLWLDGQDPLGTGTPPANGATVSSWADKSGSGNTATGVSSPLYATNSINTYASIATANGPYFTGAVSISGTTLTCFVVAKTTAVSTSPDQRLVSLVNTTNADWNNTSSCIAFFIQGGQASVFTYRAGASLAGNGVSANVPFLAVTQYTGTNGLMFFNGSAATTASGASSGSFAITKYGIANQANPTGEVWRGNVGEVILYSGALSTTDRQQVEGYLAWKWGLQGSLPSNHPYKNAPP